MKKQPAVKWLIQNNRNLRWPIVLLSFIGLVLSLTAIFFAYFSKETIDSAILGDDSRFVKYAIVISLIMLVNLVFTILNSYYKVYYKSLTEKRLKKQIFNKIIKAKPKHTSNVHSGVFMTHLESDIELIADGLTEVVPRTIFYIFRFLGAFILLFILDQLFAVMFLALGFTLFLASRLIAKPMKKRHHILQTNQEYARSYMQEGIENITVIKSFEAEDKIGKNQDDKQQNVFKAKLRKNNLTLLASGGLNLFFAFGYAFAIIFGAYRLQDGLTVGSLLAMIQLVQHIQSPFSGLSQLIPKYHQMIASTERLIVLDQFQDEIKNQTFKTNEFTQIEIRDLSFSYGSKSIFDHFNLKVSKGDMIHLNGESGKGKTTLIKLLLGLVEPKQGSIEISSNKQKIKISNETRCFFSYVPQENLMMSGTIRDNLNLFADHPDEALYQALRIAALDEEVHQLPFGLDTILGEKGYGLSEGQIQRLAIARALSKDAPILLLDEITSSVDKATELKIMESIKSLTDKTCFIVSHRPLSNDLVTLSIDI